MSMSLQLPPKIPFTGVKHLPNNYIRSKNISWRIKSTDLEEIDPMTGEIIAGTSMAAAATNTLTASDGFTWAFRQADPPSGSSPSMPVLALHGLGSSSYSYRNTLRLLSAAGHPSYAIDWIGHGSSDKPSTSTFDYTEKSYINALNNAINQLDIPRPFALIVHGFILGQYALLWALENEECIDKLVIINTPLDKNTKLRPELAAYKAPLAFMRPKPDALFDAATFNASGSPYAMQYRDAQAYAAPYESDSNASRVIHATMENVDFPSLLSKVDQGYQTWKKTSIIIHGGADSFLDLKGCLNWLDSKRTSMKMATKIEAKLGHMPQEDFADAIHSTLETFFKEES